MDIPYKLDISQDQMKAWVIPTKDELSPTETDIIQWLKNQNIIYGIIKEQVSMLTTGNIQADVPFILANGKQPIDGKNGYVQMLDKHSKKPEAKSIDFRDNLHIESVKYGEKIGDMIEPTHGAAGMNIFGMEIKPKIGRPAHIIAGKNVLIHESGIFATAEGQVCKVGDTVHVNPVFEVDGDLTLKVGNIDFVGNVIIAGNIPPGYRVKCGGDLRVSGMVEGSQLEIGGSAYIQGGITGESNGYLHVMGDVYTLYMNQCHVKAGGNITVQNSILHSYVTSGGSICSQKGHLIGGILTARKNVELFDAGNIHYTRTEINIADSEVMEMKKDEIDQHIEKVLMNIKKLAVIANKLQAKQAVPKELTTKERNLLQKQSKTNASLQKELYKLKQERMNLEYYLDIKDAELKIYGTAYPNLHIKIGKYSKPLNHVYRTVSFKEKNREITATPL